MHFNKCNPSQESFLAVSITDLANCPKNDTVAWHYITSFVMYTLRNSTIGSNNPTSKPQVNVLLSSNVLTARQSLKIRDGPCARGQRQRLSDLACSPGRRQANTLRTTITMEHRAPIRGRPTITRDIRQELRAILGITIIQDMITPTTILPIIMPDPPIRRRKHIGTRTSPFAHTRTMPVRRPAATAAPKPGQR